MNSASDLWDNFKLPNIGAFEALRGIQRKEKRERRVRKQNI